MAKYDLNFCGKFPFYEDENSRYYYMPRTPHMVGIVCRGSGPYCVDASGTWFRKQKEAYKEFSEAMHKVRLL